MQPLFYSSFSSNHLGRMEWNQFHPPIAATTFAISSVVILLLCPTLYTLYLKVSDSPHKNQTCHGWSRWNGICLAFVHIHTVYPPQNSKYTVAMVPTVTVSIDIIIKMIRLFSRDLRRVFWCVRFPTKSGSILLKKQYDMLKNSPAKNFS